MKPFARPLTDARPQPARPLRESLDRVASPEAVSPWTPRAAASAPMPSVDRAALAAIEAEARERGRAAGMAETAELRARLAAIVSKLEVACAEVSAVSHTHIADAVTTVIGAWSERAGAGDVIVPAVRAWLALGSAAEDATAHVHPADVETVRNALGDVPLVVVGDPAIARGDLSIQAAALELVHRWCDRLPQLREHVIAALEAE